MAERHLFYPALCALAAIAACGKNELPPLPEALVIVDTNLPVPLVASRLRVDFYTADGTWFDSADLARPRPTDWPASFSVFSGDASRTQRVYVRLRVYPEGHATTYLGERFRDWGAPFADPKGSGNPRLIKAGVEVTPHEEPPPLLTVDRLLLLELVPSTRGRVRVLLDGACAGTMSYLGTDGVPTADATTCTDTAKTRAPLAVAKLESDLSRPTTTAAGTWQSDPCAPGDAADGQVCIDGGGTLFGTTGLSDFTTGVNNTVAPTPARVFALSRFLIDKDEITVAAFRKAVVQGFPGDFGAYNGPLNAMDATNPNAGCTYTDAPMGREGYAMNCVDWANARRYCKYAGGDLPTEVQWEHVSTVAGRIAKTRYPWGDDLPSCDRAVFGRVSGLDSLVSCLSHGSGPAPYAQSKNDLTPLGVVGMGGDLHEWVLDDAAAYTTPCWRDTTLVDPSCVSAAAAQRVIRGASWASEPARGTFRFFTTPASVGSGVGFRCVYPAAAR